jgi:hypothetical protein
MPYPLLCSGGYPVPEHEGKMDIIGINVVPTTDGADTEVILRDHWDLSNPLTNDPSNEKNIIFRSNASGQVIFPVSIKTLRGLRAHTLSPDTEVYVYIR